MSTASGSKATSDAPRRDGTPVADAAPPDEAPTAGGAAAEKLLQVEGLTFTFPNQTKPVFENLNLDVEPGETVVIMGGSGAGKSTLAELMFQLRPEFAYQGTIRMRAAGSALLLQTGAVFEFLSVGGNLRLVLRRGGKTHEPDKLKGLLDEVSLGHHPLGSEVVTLSGGEKRRLSLARALCADPDFLYFDEPSAGLDLDNVSQQGRLIRRVVRSGNKGAIVVTHDPLLAALVADRILFLSGGKLEPTLAWPGSPDQLTVAQERERLRTIEETFEGRFLRPDECDAPPPRTTGSTLRWVGSLLRALNPLSVGDHFVGAVKAVGALPGALRHPFDFLTIWWRSFYLAGVGGIPFFSLIGAIMGATVIMILLSASILPAEVTLDKVQAVPLTAITPPLIGFLFAARSGSAIASWLGGMSYTRQVDALRTLRISPDQYLRAPVWLGMVMSFVLATITFFGAMWLGAYALVQIKVGVADPAAYLKPFGNQQITTHALMKIPLYAAIAASVTTQIGLQPKPTSEAVARGITRVIIVCTVAVAVTELTFAALLGPGGS